MTLTISEGSWMKIDMSSQAVTMRLRQVDQLRRLCLSLANSDAGKIIRQKHPDNKTVRRTSEVLGR